ncbi:TPA: hypothetical protein U2C32_000419 [Streptococcus suis]|nr:hypothetical protein [Streptococcus suis]HEM2813282.1 hypothetical protein [Streptococcus suis]HEM4445845.1 hypothetical protein [Streptococcus suis]HEM5944430.1 hypothetical protein [Streptococcus suis]HEM5960910.1 hypothetical protein [Streptococcus suis]
MNIQKYIMSLLIESAIVSVAFILLLNGVISLNIYSKIENIVLWSIFVLTLIYFILKIIALLFPKQNYIVILPTSYIISIYAVQFLLLLTKFNNQPLNEQTTMLAMFFIIVTCIDKIFDNYSKIYKKD